MRVASFRRHAAQLPLRALAVVALVVTGVVHLRLSDDYDFDQPGAAVSVGDLFLLQGVLALAAAVWLGLRGSLPAWLAGGVLMAASLVAVLTSVYVDVGSIGPLPSLYEPVWTRDKVISAVAAAGYLLLLAAVLLILRRVPASSPRP